MRRNPVFCVATFTVLARQFAGFAMDYAALDLDSAEAARWANKGFLPSEAAPWIAAGFGPDDAGRYADRFVSPADARRKEDTKMSTDTIAAALADLGCDRTIAERVAGAAIRNLLVLGTIRADDDLADLSLEARGVAMEVVVTLNGLVRLNDRTGCPDVAQPAAHAAWAVREAVRYAHVPA